MHCIFSGTAQDDIANVLVELAEAGSLGNGGPDEGLFEETGRYRTWCQENKMSVSRTLLTMRLLGRYTGRTFPELSGKVRAAPTKILHFYCAHVSRRLCDGTMHGKLSDLVYGQFASSITSSTMLVCSLPSRKQSLLFKQPTYTLCAIRPCLVKHLLLIDAYGSCAQNITICGILRSSCGPPATTPGITVAFQMKTSLARSRR